MSVRVSTLVWGHSRATGTTFLLMLALADQANDEGLAWPKRRTLARRLRIQEERTVSKLAAQAAALGELTIIPHIVDGRQLSNRYQINLEHLRTQPDLWADVTPAQGCPDGQGGVSVRTGGGVQMDKGGGVQMDRVINVSNNHQRTITKTHPISPDGEARDPGSDQPGETAGTPLTGSRQTMGKAGSRTQPATLQDVPGAAALIAAWNEHCGPLPKVETASPARVKALARLIRDLGEDAPALLTDAAREVATDPFWKERRYGLDNLLSKVPAKAEAWRARKDRAVNSPMSRRNYDKPRS